MDWNFSDSASEKPEKQVQCPWCFEWIEVVFAPDEVGRMTEDCEVCCRPWAIRIEVDAEGEQTIHVEREG